VITENQVGFMLGNGTMQRPYICSEMCYRKVHSSKETAFVCFIDFRKAFDSVWHNGLFTELKKMEIGGVFFKIILSNKLRVRTSEWLHFFVTLF
jgi:hypothetical protein